MHPLRLSEYVERSLVAIVGRVSRFYFAEIRNPSHKQKRVFTLSLSIQDLQRVAIFFEVTTNKFSHLVKVKTKVLLQFLESEVFAIIERPALTCGHCE
jgi:hypothetical protein